MEQGIDGILDSFNIIKSTLEADYGTSQSGIDVNPLWIGFNAMVNQADAVSQYYTCRGQEMPQEVAADLLNGLTVIKEAMEKHRINSGQSLNDIPVVEKLEEIAFRGNGLEGSALNFNF